MLQRALGLFSLLAAMLIASADAQAERRVAMVVGNAHYSHANPLRNPANDAQDMGAALKQLGFQVVVTTDLDQQEFARKIDEFGRLLEGADVGLFFYAGHGLQMNGKNYLVSTEARLENEFLIPAETIELDSIIQLMESRSRVNLVFLDACRNNPLADKLRQNLVVANRAVTLGRGLARVEPTGRDTLIAFAAAPGQEAADGRGRNSPFTAALLKHLPEPGVEVSVMLKRVTAQVREETNNSQRPQQLSDMSRTFYFAKAAEAATVAETKAAVQAKSHDPAPDHAIELAYWNSARSANDCGSVRAYLERFPSGIFHDLAKLSEQRLCEPDRKLTVADATAAVPPATGATVQRGQSSPAVAAVSAPADVAAPAPATTPAPSETKIAALPASAPSDASKGEDESEAGPSDLARDLQRELVRVGCSPGRPDGYWGARSRDALRQFSRHSGVKLDADEPSQRAFAAVKKHRKRVCRSAVAERPRSRGERQRSRAERPQYQPRHEPIHEERHFDAGPAIGIGLGALWRYRFRRH